MQQRFCHMIYNNLKVSRQTSRGRTVPALKGWSNIQWFYVIEGLEMLL